MITKKYIETITRYITKSSESGFRPKFVNVKNAEDMGAITMQFAGYRELMLRVSSLCKEDELPSDVCVMDALSNRKQATMLCEWTTFLMLRGRKARRDALTACMDRNYSIPVVILCYQCEDCLKELVKRDPRREEQIILIDGKQSELPLLKIVRGGIGGSTVPGFSMEPMITGIDKVAFEIESTESVEVVEKIMDPMDGCTHQETSSMRKTLIVETHYSAESLPESLIQLLSVQTPLQMIQEIDVSTSKLTDDMGEEFQWQYLLRLVGEKRKVRDAILDELNINSLNEISGFPRWNKLQKWMYFIALKLRGCSNEYISEVIQKTDNVDVFARNMYRVIVDTSWTSPEFDRKYALRKNALNEMGNPESEATDFCQWIMQKQENAFYYLTDNTRIECMTCLRLLDLYGTMENRRNRLKAVERIWPALMQYLSDLHIPVPESYQGPDLDRYFSDYKYQKVVNKVSEDFEETVRNAGKSLQFFMFAKRIGIVQDICRRAKDEQTEVWFVDALGLEFLSTLDALCRERGLSSRIHIHRAELPTLTGFNTEFREQFAAAGIEVHNVPDIDELKHHKVVDDDYVKSPLPYHLIDELDVLSKVIRKIDEALNYKGVDKAVILSDHGASRLAVISEHSQEIEAPCRGRHAGRVCSLIEIELRGDDVVNAENGNYVVTNYNRFRGGRPAEVEVHGGATIEEVLVPLVEITKPGATTQFEFVIMDEKPIPVSPHNCAVVHIFSKTNFKSLKIRLVDAKYAGCEFEGTSPDGQNFEFECPCITKPGTYTFEICRDDKCIKDGFSFKTVNKGMVCNNDDW